MESELTIILTFVVFCILCGSALLVDVLKDNKRGKEYEKKLNDKRVDK